MEEKKNTYNGVLDNNDNNDGDGQTIMERSEQTNKGREMSFEKVSSQIYLFVSMNNISDYLDLGRNLEIQKLSIAMICIRNYLSYQESIKICQKKKKKKNRQIRKRGRQGKGRWKKISNKKKKKLRLGKQDEKMGKKMKERRRKRERLGKQIIKIKNKK